jgi:hypothetical protein
VSALNAQLLRREREREKTVCLVVVVVVFTAILLTINKL